MRESVRGWNGRRLKARLDADLTQEDLAATAGRPVARCRLPGLPGPLPGYIAGWSRGKAEVITGAMDRATKAFNKIMDGPWSSSTTKE